MTELVPSGPHSQTLSAGQGCIAPSKWTLLQVIEDVREPLGLKGTSISLLRAMISFIKGDRLTSVRDDGHICFASNAALAKRTHVSIQTVERHVSKLVSLGLIRRRASANGKRWARRDISGRVVLATGLSLIPLLERHEEFTQLNQAHQDKLINLSILRDKCAIALTQLKSSIGLHPSFETIYHTARNLLRRRATKDALTTLLEKLTSEIERYDCEDRNNLRGTVLKNEGHKEPDLNQSIKEDDAQVDPDQMEQAYPRLCAELKSARTPFECERRMGDIAKHLNLGNLWFDIQDLGAAKAFMTLGYLLERIEGIERPRGYAFSLLQGLNSGTIAWQSLLNTAQGNANTRIRAQTVG